MSASRGQPHRGSVARSLALLGFVALYAATGFWTLDPASRAVPLLTALVTAALIGVEIFRSVSSGARADEATADASVRRGHETRVLASVVAGVAAIYVVGFLIALPLYLVVAIALIGRQPWRIAIATGLLTTAAIYVAFEIVLSYRLFPGIAFA